MTLPASLQWDLLPPLRLKVAEATSSGVLEPAYEVGGDCFDHAVNGLDLEVAIMDAMGHGLGASLLSGLAIGTYRHDRREKQSLSVMHDHLDQALHSQFHGDAFVTGQLARLHLASGELTWINAGHPLPLLVRAGRVVGPLACEPSAPWGLGGAMVEQRREVLEPGDAVVFYTDGVIEGRSPGGVPFGTDRLVGLVERAVASRTPSDAIIHQLMHEIVIYQNRRLRDDATLVWLSWNPPAIAD
jgi:serine phosphatase RsbU (regulator of sigma subunit)